MRLGESVDTLKLTRNRSRWSRLVGETAQWVSETSTRMSTRHAWGRAPQNASCQRAEFIGRPRGPVDIQRAYARIGALTSIIPTWRRSSSPLAEHLNSLLIKLLGDY